MVTEFGSRRMTIKRYLSTKTRCRCMLLFVFIPSFIWIFTADKRPSSSLYATASDHNKTDTINYGVTIKSSENPYRVMAENCSGSLELSLDDIKAKISSYEFPGVETYLKDLFPSNVLKSTPDFPHFVTALSSNHFEEGKVWLENFNKVPRVRYPNLKLYIYDIGLTLDEETQIRHLCNCTYRKFPFERFPAHVRLLRVYAWKPIIIQLIVNEHPFIIWMDTSVAFEEPIMIGSLIEEAKSKGVLAAKTPAKVANRVFRDTFEFLKEEPCLYRDLNIFGARFIVAYVTPFEQNYLLKPWVSCALIRDCIVTKENPEHIVDCSRVTDDIYFNCHRFDQGVLSILMNRLYHKRANEHEINKINGSYVIRTKRL